MKASSFIYVITAVLMLCSCGDDLILKGRGFTIRWDGNLELSMVKVAGHVLPQAENTHYILYSESEISREQLPVYGEDGSLVEFPEPHFTYITGMFRDINSPAAFNVAGEAVAYRFTKAEKLSYRSVRFTYEGEDFGMTETWTVNEDNDVIVEQNLTAHKAGWYSIASPAITATDKENFEWATIPGYTRSNFFNPNFIQAYIYSIGLPEKPVVYRERSASTLTSIVTDSNGISIAATAMPGQERDPWKGNTMNYDWELGISHMSRYGDFCPTLYRPVIGEENSFLKEGETASLRTCYTLSKADWYETVTHILTDIYPVREVSQDRKLTHSLSNRLKQLHSYLLDEKTSLWKEADYGGVRIGAQHYYGGVVGSENDAIKNADYGTMWMMAELSRDSILLNNRLPLARAFKTAQQRPEGDMFSGAAKGQYYLYKSGKFTEEWGEHTEPVANTYYMLCDLGNMSLFMPEDKEIKDGIRLAADRLLEWMHPEGRWEIAYDNHTGEPLYTDIPDLRPTFYGLVIAYRILGDEKYLEAACRGADWLIENGVEKGAYIGVCGDTRFAPDFATIQCAQGLWELYEINGGQKYLDAAIKAAKHYTNFIMTHPLPTDKTRICNGTERQDWEISQIGLNTEHIGNIASSNNWGPILLSSYAGMFVRMSALTGDELMLDLSRAAVTAQQAFVHQPTGVASYYWKTMDRGAGAFPHHAWWQIGWIMDYLVAEAQTRSCGEIDFPAGFFTPKVGPHRPFGFAEGKIGGETVELCFLPDDVFVENPYVEYLTAKSTDDKILYVILMSNSANKQDFSLKYQENVRIDGELEPYGLKVVNIVL